MAVGSLFSSLSRPSAPPPPRPRASAPFWLRPLRWHCGVRLVGKLFTSRLLSRYSGTSCSPRSCTGLRVRRAFLPPTARSARGPSQTVAHRLSLRYRRGPPQQVRRSTRFARPLAKKYPRQPPLASLFPPLLLRGPP
eukprot:7848243-Pyramimonas_sp.AAC.1